MSSAILLVLQLEKRSLLPQTKTDLGVSVAPRCQSKIHTRARDDEVGSPLDYFLPGTSSLFSFFFFSFLLSLLFLSSIPLHSCHPLLQLYSFVVTTSPHLLHPPPLRLPLTLPRPSQWRAPCGIPLTSRSSRTTSGKMCRKSSFHSRLSRYVTILHLLSIARPLF